MLKEGNTAKIMKRYYTPRDKNYNLLCTDYYFTVSTKFVISFYPITAVLTSYATNKTMKRFIANARLQNKTVLLTRGWQFVFGGFLRSAEDQRLSFIIVSSY